MFQLVVTKPAAPWSFKLIGAMQRMSLEPSQGCSEVAVVNFIRRVPDSPNVRQNGHLTVRRLGPIKDAVWLLVHALAH
jgi:hypothetical protein